ncbi:MAG TPA: isoprenylcysteine carboxylmethyltransferase family protein [Rhizomicrobium sp.]|jgi:protein-S-isoprenylcysteine O-methyltransferase Ste14
MSAERAIFWLWAIWYGTWLLSVFWAGKSTARPNMREHGSYQLVTMIAIALLFFTPLWWPAAPQLWTMSETAGWILFALTALCFAFCWWARLTMGRLWNGFVGRTQDHRIVDSGPFAIVRHPIYTGIIAAGFLLAIDLGTVPALAGAALLALAFWMKARLEERFLRQELGTQAYDAYSRRVPMLIPFGPTSS